MIRLKFGDVYPTRSLLTEETSAAFIEELRRLEEEIDSESDEEIKNIKECIRSA